MAKKIFEDLTKEDIANGIATIANVGADTAGSWIDNSISNVPNANAVQQNLYSDKWGDFFNGDRGIMSNIYSQQVDVADPSMFSANMLQNNIDKATTGQLIGKGLSNTVGDAAKGASMGSTFGVPGMLIGAAAGAISGLGRSFIMGSRNNKLADRAQNAINISNQNTINSLADSMTRKDSSDVRNYLLNSYKQGGDMNPINNGVNIFDGPSHKDNTTLPGIPQGINQSDGLPNFVEGDEVKYEDYIFSDKLKVNKKLLKDVNLPDKYEGMTYADIAKKLQKESEDRPSDPISKRTLDDMMSRLRQAQEVQKFTKQQKEMAKLINSLPDETKAQLAQEMMAQQNPSVYEDGGSINIKPSHRGRLTDLKKRTGKTEAELYASGGPAVRKMITFARNARKWHKGDYGMPLQDNPERPELLDKLPTLPITYYIEQNGEPKITPVKNSMSDLPPVIGDWMHKAPVYGAAMGFANSVLQPVDTRLGTAIRNTLPTLQHVKPQTIANNDVYTPIDENYTANQLAAQANALKRQAAMTRTTAGANLAYLNQQLGNQLAAQRMTAAQQNITNRQAVNKNRAAIDQQNASAIYNAALQNAEIDAKKAAILQAAAQADDAARSAWSKAYADNSTNFYNQLGALGKENMNWDWLDLLYNSGYFDNPKIG